MPIPMLEKGRIGISLPTFDPDHFLLLLLKAKDGQTNVWENIYIGWGLLLSPKFRKLFVSIRTTYSSENWLKLKIKFFILIVAHFVVLALTPLIAFYFLSNQAIVWNIIEINKGHIGFVILPDSSFVNLNAGSSLKVAANYNSTPVLCLDGEGVFNLKAGNGRKVILKTRVAEILARENTFNVSTHNDDLSITSLDGTINIKTNKGPEVSLKTGFALKYDFDKETWTTVKINKDTVTSWLNGVYYMNEEKLERICKRIERVYDVKIVFDSDLFKGYRFSGKFRKKDSINVILANLSSAGGLKYCYDRAGVIHWR